MELQCPECGYEYEVDGEKMEDSTCPECGFGPDVCSHPMSYRESELIYDVGEGREIEQIYCGKCGLPISEM